MKRLYSVCFSLGFLALSASARADMIYDFTGAEQTFTADVSGQYQINVWGAGGGLYGPHPSFGGEGGGAEIGAFFSLSAGETLSLYVGQTGLTGDGGGGGGGGSFVVTSGGAPLIIAGGGGGAGQEGAAFIENVGGQTGTDGGTDSNGTGAGGRSGNGGAGGTYLNTFGLGQNGAGGAGFYSNGGNGAGVGSGFGGSDFPTFAGGSGNVDGGFGGGGGGGQAGGGGGGGYSGGGGGGTPGNPAGSGGGGGSYLDITGTMDLATGNVNFGDGKVQIVLVSSEADSPEPASFTFAGLGLLLVAGIRRSRFAQNRVCRTVN